MTFYTANTPIPTNSIWKKMTATWQVLGTISKAIVKPRRIGRAITKLESFSDYELADIGLCRSDLTPDGLALASVRRKARQAAIAKQTAAGSVK